MWGGLSLDHDASLYMRRVVSLLRATVTSRVPRASPIFFKPGRLMSKVAVNAPGLPVPLAPYRFPTPTLHRIPTCFFNLCVGDILTNFSPAVTANGFIFLSGQVGLNAVRDPPKS